MKKAPRIMVCVTVQPSSGKLIRAGAEIARSMEGLLYVVHVAKVGAAFLGNENQGEALEHLYQLSRELDAEMSVLRADDVLEALVRTARNFGADILVLGAPGRAQRGEQVALHLALRLPHAQIRTIEGD